MVESFGINTNKHKGKKMSLNNFKEFRDEYKNDTEFRENIRKVITPLLMAKEVSLRQFALLIENQENLLSLGRSIKNIYISNDDAEDDFLNKYFPTLKEREDALNKSKQKQTISDIAAAAAEEARKLKASGKMMDNVAVSAEFGQRFGNVEVSEVSGFSKEMERQRAEKEKKLGKYRNGIDYTRPK